MKRRHRRGLGQSVMFIPPCFPKSSMLMVSVRVAGRRSDGVLALRSLWCEAKLSSEGQAGFVKSFLPVSLLFED